MVVLIRKANAIISRQSIKIIHPRERFLQFYLRISLGAGPRSCVVQKIIIGVIYHTFRAKMNHLRAFDMPDNQQPRRVLIAAKAFVRNIIIMKTITFFIMVCHINCLKGF
jgi:hypothetical protein